MKNYAEGAGSYKFLHKDGGSSSGKGEAKARDNSADLAGYLKKSGLPAEAGAELREAFWDPDLYFLHPDHLGTATLVTNSQGREVQYFRNLPWGETDVEQNTGQYDNPYKFNGKELDEESGLYYYGARYYNPRLGIWYGVDPLAETYPSWSPYVYVYNNPVRFTDSTGMCPDGDCPDEIRTQNIEEVRLVGRASWWQRNIARPLRDFFSGPIHQPTSSDRGYRQVTSNTLIADQGPNQSPQYRFILPQNFGGWSQDDTASDGMIYKGCLSCHADNGAYNYAAHNSQEAIAGQVAAAVIGAIVGGTMVRDAEGGTMLFEKDVVTTTTRMGRDGKAVEVIFKDGSKIDINAARVKQWTPNTHPNAPSGTLQKVKFENSLPGSKGYKRTPTQSELDFLNGL